MKRIYFVKNRKYHMPKYNCFSIYFTRLNIKTVLFLDLYWHQQEYLRLFRFLEFTICVNIHKLDQKYFSKALC